MKKLSLLLVAVLITLCFVGCGTEKTVTPDYTDAASFEAALNEGADMTGKIVQFTVSEFVPNSALGYNMQAGEHLNFCSSSSPKVQTGDTVIVEVTEVTSSLGSYIISYKMK